MTHRLYRPSSIGRVIACPPSSRLPQENKASSFAYEGTAQHTLNEICLRLELTPEECRGESIAVFDDDGKEVDRYIVNDEMVDCAKFFLGYLGPVEKSMRSIYGDSVKALTEQRLQGPHIAQFFQGTIDRLYISSKANSAAFIVDYKHGKGVKVVAANNAQLKAYALLVIENYKNVESVTTSIVQPRIYGDKITTAEYSRDELKAFEKEIRQAVVNGNRFETLLRKDERAAKAMFVTGDHCRWCPAKASCPLKDQIPKFGFGRKVTTAADDFSDFITKG